MSHRPGITNMPVPSSVAAACVAAVASSMRAIRFPSTTIVFRGCSLPFVTSTMVTLSMVVVWALTWTAGVGGEHRHSHVHPAQSVHRLLLAKGPGVRGESIPLRTGGIIG